MYSTPVSFRHLVCILILFLCTPLVSRAQTVMSIGDLAFTGYNSNDGTNGATMNQVSLIILRPGGLQAGTVFHLTDNGYSSVTGALTTVEGDITVTLGVALPQFTEIFVNAGTTGTGPVTITQNSSGTFSSANISAGISGTFQLSISGDQVFALQGSIASPSFITGIHMNSEIVGSASQPATTAANWDAIASTNGPTGWIMTSNRSSKPPVLTNGTDCIIAVVNPGNVAAERDNGVYQCAQSSAGSLVALRNKLMDVTNWTLQEPAPLTLPSACTYALGAGPSITTQPTNKFTCAGTGVSTFSVTANNATGYQWYESTNGGVSFSPLANGGVYSGVTTANLTITNATAGMNANQYYVIVTGAALPNATSSIVTLSVSSISTSTNTSSPVSCFGGSNGTATVTPSGGIGSYTYSWSPFGGTGATASGLSQGGYTVTVTDGIGCTKTQSFSISQPTAALSSTAGTVNPVSCFGGSNGTATVIPSGGTPSYMYSWSPSGGTGATTTGRNAGTYTVTITDNNSCTTSRTFSITQPAAALSSTGSSTPVSCFGGSNGTATVVASNGTPGYTYSWAPSGGTGSTASGLSANTYTVTVTDNNSCTTSRTFNVTQPAVSLSTTGSSTPVSCFGGSNGTATVVASNGSPGYTYSWAPSGGTSATASGLSANTYTVTVTDNNSCTTSRTYTITQPVSALSSTGSSTPVNCFGGSNGTATVVPAGGTPGYTYSWAPSGGTSATASGLSANTYTVTITDNNLCTTSRTFNITQPPTGMTASQGGISNISCFGGNDGNATVNVSGGTGTYSYAWSPSGGTGATASGLTQGNYTVTITDNSGCTTSQTFTLTQPSAISLTPAGVNPVSCFAGTNGSAEVGATGGTGSLTYSWSSGGTNATENGLSAGTYTVTVTDANSCSQSLSFTITEPSQINSSFINVNHVDCNGNNTGSAEISATGGTGTLQYSWSSGGNTNTEPNLSAGTYTVTVTDANACTHTNSVTITQPVAINITSLVTNPLCNADSNGSIDLTVTGGVTNYSYVWSNSAITEDISSLAAGNYSVTVTDANGCTQTHSSVLNDPAALNIGFTPTPNDTVCSGTIVSISGTGADSYVWTGGIINGAGFPAVASSTYTVTGTDLNGCSATTTWSLVVNPNPVADLGPDIIQANPPALLDAGNGFSSYLWSTSAVTSTISVNTNGTFIVTVTDLNGCTDSDTIEVAFTSGIFNTNGTATTLTLYPNPSADLVNLRADNLYTSYLVMDILDINGSVVRSLAPQTANGSLVHPLDISSLGNGMYILRIQANGETVNLRFIKN